MNIQTNSEQKVTTLRGCWEKLRHRHSQQTYR